MSVGPGGTPVRGQLVSLPAWLFPPSDCRPLDLTTPVPVVVPAVNVVTDAPGEALVLTFDVPLGASLRVTGLGCSSADPSDLAMISWAVRTNGNPYNGYQYLPAPVGTIDQPAEVVILVDAGRQLQIVAVNGGEIDAHLVARITGWTYDPAAAGS